MGLPQISTSNFMSHHYFNQTGILFKSATCPLRSQILRVTETNSLRILRGRHRGTRLRNCLDVKWLCRVIPRWLSSPGVALRNMMPGMTKLFMTQSLKIGVNLHSFVHTLLWCIDIMPFRVFKVTVVLFGCSPLGSTERHLPERLTVGQLLYSSDCRGTGRAT